MSETVQWPKTTAEDLAHPARVLLEDLNLLETKQQQEQGTGPWKTPWSLQVITAGATALTKWVATLGGFAGIAATLTAVISSTQIDTTSIRITLLAAAALIAAVTIFSIALIVRADVTARAAVTAAEYRARAEMVSSYLHTGEPVAVVEEFKAAG